MISQSDVARKIRQYFIEVEKRWNSSDSVINRAMELSPEIIMAKALEYANAKLKAQDVKPKVQKLKVEYFDEIFQPEGVYTVRTIGSYYNLTAQQLNTILEEEGVQYKSGDRWYLYEYYMNHDIAKPRSERGQGKGGQLRLN